MRETQKTLCAMLATATSTVLLVIASTTKAANAAALRGLI